MENWRFLIQREGDREWLPLEPPESEILEGCYRLVGQSQPGQRSVQIHLAYRDLEGGSPRHHRRVGQTNDRGLVGIFPFTRLQPGHWQVTCGLDGAAVALHLQVVPHDGGSELEADLDLSRFSAFRAEVNHADLSAENAPIVTSERASPPAVSKFDLSAARSDRRWNGQAQDPAGRRAEDEAAKPLTDEVVAPLADEMAKPLADEVAKPLRDEAASVANLFQTVEDMADQIINAMSARLAVHESLAEPSGGAATSVQSEDPAQSALPSALPGNIQLYDSAYTIRRGRPLRLGGLISGPELGLPATLTLVLIDPHSGEAIAKQTYPQAIAHIPQAFDWDAAVSLPPQTQLVLAQLALRSIAPAHSLPLAACSFAIMVLNEPSEPSNPFTPAVLEPSGSIGAPSSSDPSDLPASGVELPPFLKGVSAVPAETRAAALAKVEELKLRQLTPKDRPDDSKPPGHEASGDSEPSRDQITDSAARAEESDKLNGDSSDIGLGEDAINPFQYPGFSEY